MAKINVESGGTILSSGLLQLSGGAAMSSTLTAVTDQNNTASPLNLSTTSVQVTSPLRITTDDPSDFYLDCEDGSTNNRFSIKRNTASQQVNVDFASNPGSSTEIVGGIRTYVDGVNLSNVMQFRRDGRLQIGSTAASAMYWDNTNNRLGIGTNAPSATAHIVGANSLSSGYAVKVLNSSGGGILSVTNDGYTQIGDFTGQGFGTLLTFLRPAGGTRLTTFNQGNSNLVITNGIGNVTFQNTPVQVVGSGSTSATTSLLVQNSGGNNALQIQDNFNAIFGSTATKILTIRPEDTTGTFGNSCSIRGGNGNGRLDFFSASNITQLSDNILILAGNSNSMQIGTSGISASISGNAFSINSTTQGFLPPRMTNAQRAAIAAPAVGLMVYCTDAVEGLYVYKSTGWTFVI